MFCSMRWPLVVMALIALSMSVSSIDVAAHGPANTTASSPESTTAATATITPAIPTASSAPETIAAAPEDPVDAITRLPAPEPLEIGTSMSPVVTGAVTRTTSELTLQAPIAAQAKVSESSATELPESTSSHGRMRASDASGLTSASSQSSASKSASESTTDSPTDFTSTKSVVLFMICGVGFTISMSLLFVLWRNRMKNKDSDLETTAPPNAASISFPAIAIPPIIVPDAQVVSSWKASKPSIASQPDILLSASDHTKLDPSMRSSVGHDLTNGYSQVASLPLLCPLMQTPQANRETNSSSEQSISIRGYSDFSMHHDSEGETFAVMSERDSASTAYLARDRCSTYNRYSVSSRLSSVHGRNSSDWFQLLASEQLDIYRVSSASSTTFSVATTEQVRLPHANVHVTLNGTTSRTDVPTWYVVIQSPTDNNRCTTTSIDSDDLRDDRESYEL
uniref:Membrane-associated protein n=1 Tax=Peronospora matthiolae TaxID=2874970 RepID=A0AAV1VNG1_9STRA